MTGKLHNLVVLFCGLGSTGALLLLGALWLVHASENQGVLALAGAAVFTVVSSVLGLLASFRYSKDKQIDRDSEAQDIFRYSLCCLIFPFGVYLLLGLSALIFRESFQSFLEAEYSQVIDQTQSGFALTVIGLSFLTLSAVIAGTLLYAMTLEREWTLAHDTLTTVNFLLLALSHSVVYCTVVASRLSSALDLHSSKLVSVVTISAGGLGSLAAYFGWLATHRSSVSLLQGYVLLSLFLCGLNVVASMDGWVTGQKASDHLDKNCLNSLTNADEDLLHQMSCDSKYTTLASTEDDLSCAKAEIRFVWEVDDGELSLGRQYGCLNSSCCDILSSGIVSGFDLLGMQEVAIIVVCGLASCLAATMIKQIAYEDKEHFGDQCLLLTMLSASVALGGVLIFTSSYSHPPDLQASPIDFAIPPRLLTAGACVNGLFTTNLHCSHCSGSVSAENGIVYHQSKAYETLTLSSRSQEDMRTALNAMVICPICINSSMRVLVKIGEGPPEEFVYNYEGRMDISGLVTTDESPVSNARVTVTVSGCKESIITTSSDGRFRTSIPTTPDNSPYPLLLKVNSDSYPEVKMTQSICGLLSNASIPLHSIILQSSSSLQSSIAIYVFNALTNDRMKEGTVEVREGYNNDTGPIFRSLNVSSEGVAMWEGAFGGVYTLLGKCEGYLNSLTEVVLRPNTHQEKALVLSPVDQFRLRVVLGWETTQDLDLRVSFWFQEKLCVVDFANVRCGGAQLHSDNALSGYSGGETISLLQVVDTRYLFSVRVFKADNLTDDFGVEGSGATIQVYIQDRLSPVLILHVPEQSEFAREWAAFCVDGETGLVQTVAALTDSSLDPQTSCLHPAPGNFTPWTKRP